MRMWMVPVEGMCNKHLLGEHVEHHMFVGSLNKELSMDGYVRNNLMEPTALLDRHDELAREMGRRGMNHKSPLPPYRLGYLTDYQITASVDVEDSLKDLITRCPDCHRRMAPIIKDMVENGLLDSDNFQSEC